MGHMCHAFVRLLCIASLRVVRSASSDCRCSARTFACYPEENLEFTDLDGIGGRRIVRNAQRYMIDGVYIILNYSTNASHRLLLIRLPMGIPAGTAVPSWAYQDVITKGSFDITVVNGTTAPDSTVAVNGPTSSSSVTSTSTSIFFYPTSKSSFFPSASGTPTATSSSSKSNNAGAIAGGVVGGVVGLVGIGLLIFLILRHKKKKRSGYGSGAREATGEVGGPHTPRLSGYYAGGNPPMTQTVTPVSAGSGSLSTPNSGASLLGGQKIYVRLHFSVYSSVLSDGSCQIESR